MMLPDHVFSLALRLGFALLCAHAIADYCLQPELMIRSKHPGRCELGRWQWWLIAHGLCCAGCAWAATSSAWAGAVTLWTHVWIDESKIRGQITETQDQALHLAGIAMAVVAALLEMAR